VDFGLASHYTSKEYKPDPKKMHNGTIEYTSRDAHNGVPTMRGDLEILAYNLIQWLAGQLPWEKSNLLQNPAKVQQAKEDSMKNIDKFMKTCFDKKIPAPIHQFVKYVGQLDYDENPDYPKVRKFFLDGLKTLGKPDSGPLEFTEAVSNGKAEKNLANKAKKQKSDEIVEASPEVEPVRRGRIRKAAAITPESSPEIVPVKKNRKKADEPKEPKENKKKEDQPTKEPSVKAGSSKTGTVKLSSDSTDKKKKTIEVNLELDISIDADVVVNLHRKDKKKKKPSKLDNSVEEIPDSDEEDISIQGKLYKKAKTDKKQDAPTRVSPRKPPPFVARAGEYKGKKAKTTN
jgi:vaccinia related kinase